MDLDGLEPEERGLRDRVSQCGAYLARWERWEEAGQEGYKLHKHNCPYAGIV
ncbi:MAG: hypothetical protein R2838_11940 [Caldilineaceae bacterium]